MGTIRQANERLSKVKRVKKTGKGQKGVDLFVDQICKVQLPPPLSTTLRERRKKEIDKTKKERKHRPERRKVQSTSVERMPQVKSRSKSQHVNRIIISKKNRTKDDSGKTESENGEKVELQGFDTQVEAATEIPTELDCSIKHRDSAVDPGKTENGEKVEPGELILGPGTQVETAIEITTEINCSMEDRDSDVDQVEAGGFDTQVETATEIPTELEHRDSAVDPGKTESENGDEEKVDSQGFKTRVETATVNPTELGCSTKDRDSAVDPSKTESEHGEKVEHATEITTEINCSMEDRDSDVDQVEPGGFDTQVEIPTELDCSMKHRDSTCDPGKTESKKVAESEIDRENSRAIEAVLDHLIESIRL